MLKLDDILGQDAAIRFLQRACAKGRLPHGMIFAGPVGVGKATTAVALAAWHLCHRPVDPQRPCGTCDSCRLIDAGTHPDFHVIVKELIRYHDKTGQSKGIDLSMEVIRHELIDPANRTAMLGHGKVFVVEQAELMTTAAQNAALKTLEEPARSTLIILLSDQPGLLLPTIRSRCQVVPFASLDVALVRQELARRGIDADAARGAAALSEGSLGRAIQWIQDGVVERAPALQQMMRHVMDRAADGGEHALPEWLRQSADAYADKQLERDKLASRDQAVREGLSLYFRLAAQVFQQHLSQVTDSDELARACTIIEALVRAERYLDANVNIPLILLQLASTLRRQYVA